MAPSRGSPPDPHRPRMGVEAAGDGGGVEAGPAGAVGGEDGETVVGVGAQEGEVGAEAADSAGGECPNRLREPSGNAHPAPSGLDEHPDPGQCRDLVKAKRDPRPPRA